MNRKTHKGVVRQDGAFVLLHFEASELDSVSEAGSKTGELEVSRIFKEIELESDRGVIDVYTAALREQW
jgi:hypothetical protein